MTDTHHTELRDLIGQVVEIAIASRTIDAVVTDVETVREGLTWRSWLRVATGNGEITVPTTALA